MIVFSLFGFMFTFDGSKFTGDNRILVDLYNLYTPMIRGYFPPGHNLYLILKDIYPDLEFDFTNEDREQFFYLFFSPTISIPSHKNDVVI